MRRLLMIGDAIAAVQNTSPNQAWFFVTIGRNRDACIAEAHISQDIAKRAARLRGGRILLGHVDAQDPKYALIS